MKALNLRTLSSAIALLGLVSAAGGPSGLSLFKPAQATSFYEQPFPDSIKDAPVIVRGKVGPSYVDYGHGTDTNKRIYTFWELQIQEVLKGDAEGQLLRMREIGGEKDGRGMQVAGTAHFNPGEDVVVFLSTKNSEGSYDIWGMMMGKYNVQKDEGGKEFLQGPGINGLTQGRVRDDDEGHGDTRSAPKWTLDKVRGLIASQGGAPVAARPKTAEKPEVMPRASGVASTAPSPDPAASLAAPQLQSYSSEEQPHSVGIGFAIAGGLLGLFLMTAFFRKRRR